MIDNSVARGIASMTLRDVAEAWSFQAAPPPSLKRGNARKARAFLIGFCLNKIRPLVLCEQRANQLGYGGAAAYVYFDKEGDRAITLKSAVLYGTRSDTELLRIVHGPAICFTKHALERLHQRKALWNFQELRAEFLPSAMSLFALAWAAASADIVKEAVLRQLCLPCLGGSLRCDVEAPLAMTAKTYVPTASPREQALFDDLQALYDGMSLKHVGARLVWFPYLMIKRAENALHAADIERYEVADGLLAGAAGVMERLIRRHGWLAEPYKERDDPADEAWRHYNDELRSAV